MEQGRVDDELLPACQPEVSVVHGRHVFDTYLCCVVRGSKRHSVRQTNTREGEGETLPLCVCARVCLGACVGVCVVSYYCVAVLLLLLMMMI